MFSTGWILISLLIGVTVKEAVTEDRSQLTTLGQLGIEDDFDNITAIQTEPRVTEDPHELVSFPAEEKERVKGKRGDVSVPVIDTKNQTKTEAVTEDRSQLTTLGQLGIEDDFDNITAIQTEPRVTEDPHELVSFPAEEKERVKGKRGDVSVPVIDTKNQTKTEAVTEDRSQLTTLGQLGIEDDFDNITAIQTEPRVTEDPHELVSFPAEEKERVKGKRGDVSVPVIDTKNQTKTEAITEDRSQLTTLGQLGIEDDFDNITAIQTEPRVTEDPHELVSFPAEEKEETSSFLLSHTGGILEGSLATLCVVLLVIIFLIIKRRNRTRVMLMRKPDVTVLRPYEPKRRHEARVSARLRSRKVLPDLPEVPSHTKNDQLPDATTTQNLYHSLIFNIPRKQLSSTSRTSRVQTLSLLSVNSNYVTAIASPKQAVNSLNDTYVDPYATIESLGVSTLVCQANDNQSTVATSISPTSRDQIISLSNGYSDDGDFSLKLENDVSELIQPTYSSGYADSDKSTMQKPKAEKPVWRRSVSALITQAKQRDTAISRTNSDVMETKV